MPPTKRKRGQGKGSIRRRPNGTYEVRVTMGTRPDGKPDRPSRYFHTRQEARDYLKQVQAALLTGEIVSTSKTLLRDWGAEVLDSYGNELADSTYRQYRSFLANHVNPARIGGMRLGDILPIHCQEYITALRETPGTRGIPDDHGVKPPISSKTARNICMMVSMFFAKAVDNRLIQSNPMAGCTLPPKIKPKLQAIRPELLESFWIRVMATPDYPIYVLLCSTGARRGEVLGLKWDCVDLEAATIIIQRQLVRSRNGGWQVVDTDPLKTSNAYRVINLPPEAVHALREHRRKQAALRMRMGPLWADEDLVFTNRFGRYLDPDGVTDRFQDALVASGHPHCRLHDVRHMFATALIRSRQLDDTTISRILGHSSTRITREIYQDIYQEDKKKGADIISAVLNIPKAP